MGQRINPIGQRVRIRTRAFICAGQVGTLLGFCRPDTRPPSWYQPYRFQSEDEQRALPVCGTDIDGYYQDGKFIPLTQYLEVEFPEDEPLVPEIVRL